VDYTDLDVSALGSKTAGAGIVTFDLYMLPRQVEPGAIPIRELT
jgi:hypothetical protein